jgi:transglutaminase-like putative cysteine protease
MRRLLCLFALLVLAIPSATRLQAAQPAVAEKPAARSVREFAKRFQGRFAFGVFVQENKKVGWETEEAKLGQHDGKDVLIVTSESFLSISVDGEKSVSRELTTTSYELEGEGAIVHARVVATEDGRTTTREVVRKGRELVITTKDGKRTSSRKVPLPRDTLLVEEKFDAWLRAGPKKGDRFTKYSVSWNEEEIEAEEVYTFQEKKSIVLGGVMTFVYVVETESRGARQKAELLPDTRPLTGTLSSLFTIKREKEAVAKKMDGEAVDLLHATSIVVDTDLGRSRNVNKLTLELTGLHDFPLPQSHRQILERGKDTSTLTLSRDFKVEKPVPLNKEERDKHLRATHTIQCDHEAIKTQAKKIVGEETEPLEIARRIERWVYKTLRKSYSDNADNALAVLDQKAGDCTEHAILFVALARAAGVPAREVGGVAFVKTSKPMFGWHAWAEIHDGKQWVTIDPTWDQVFVDATHIKFSEGSRDLTWVNLVGKLKIKVVKFEKR